MLFPITWIPEKSGVIHSHSARNWHRGHNIHVEHSHGITPTTSRPSDHSSSLPVAKNQSRKCPMEDNTHWGRSTASPGTEGENENVAIGHSNYSSHWDKYSCFCQKHHMKRNVTDCSCISHPKEKKKFTKTFQWLDTESEFKWETKEYFICLKYVRRNHVNEVNTTISTWTKWIQQLGCTGRFPSYNKKSGKWTYHSTNL